MSTVSPVADEPTPTRPPGLELPAHVQRATVDVEVAHLANPAVAVARLLASEAGAFARVIGDDNTLCIDVALPDSSLATRHRAAQWIGWAVHCAGVRGRTTFDPVVTDH